MNYRKLLRVVMFIPDRIQAKISPVRYAKRKGVTMKGSVHFYGMPHLSTEPWLITLGDNVHITNGVQFLTHDGGVLIFQEMNPDIDIIKPITVGDNVYIGINSIILPGVTIGNNCIIGAGSVVTKDIPNHSVAVGVPAKVIKTTDEYYQKALKNSVQTKRLSYRDKKEELKRIYNK